MKTVTMYEAKDCKVFRSKSQCLEHEQLLDATKAANDMLQNGATLMAVLNRANQTRPWWDSGLTLEDKVFLMGVTKDTGFAVPHWQCSYDPEYRVKQINEKGQLLLFGHQYGNWVELKGLLRYAQKK